MLRKVLFAFVMVILCVAFATADTITGKVTKIDEKGVTVATKDNKEGKAYEFAKEWKLFLATKDAKEELTGDAKAARIKAIAEKGSGATIETNKDGKVTEVTIKGKKK